MESLGQERIRGEALEVDAEGLRGTRRRERREVRPRLVRLEAVHLRRRHGDERERPPRALPLDDDRDRLARARVREHHADRDAPEVACLLLGLDQVRDVIAPEAKQAVADPEPGRFGRSLLDDRRDDDAPVPGDAEVRLLAGGEDGERLDVEADEAGLRGGSRVGGGKRREEGECEGCADCHGIPPVRNRKRARTGR
ncbi:MAG: hypothetical protein L6Q95_13695 [Planctomycetes bacterium]|nr:hypothetical protein [Planctomycetota bacterium]